ncbi:MAG: potassium channel protein [Deltaproteobacteria bacterium]|nr:potassium channel protein [Deltaproteobacteria bacterium]
MQSDLRRELLKRLYTAAAVLGGVIIIGATGYHVIGDGRWSWFDCVYMTVITLSTVGYGEVLGDMNHDPFARMWTISQIVLGSGTLLYFISTFTAFLIESDLQGVIRRNRMKNRIDKLTDHIIVVGVGSTGIHLVRELASTKTAFVAVDNDAQRMERAIEEFGPDILFVVGDATDDHVLESAGIKRAKSLAANLSDDKDNVFVCITARALNPRLRIVARATEPNAEAKLKRAGADTAVSPSAIGGMRIASELIRPNVVVFLDQMLRGRDPTLRIEEVRIPEKSSLVNAALQNTNIRKHTDVLVLAVRNPDGTFEYNPGPDFVLRPDVTLVVLAKTDDLIRLRKGIESGAIGRV